MEISKAEAQVIYQQALTRVAADAAYDLFCQFIGARLGILIFGSNFWDPHWKQNPYFVFDSGYSGRNLF
jgi:hypothetical protein